MIKKRGIFIFLVLFIGSVLGGLLLVRHFTDINNKTAEIEGITLSIEAPFSTSSLAIDGNGNVLYTAQRRYQNEIIQESGSFSFLQMQVLKALARTISFKERPQDTDDPVDGSNYAITIKYSWGPNAIGPLERTVKCYQFSCDENFLRLKDKIIEFWGKPMLNVGV